MRDYFDYNPARPKQRQNYMLTNFVSNYDDLGRPSVEQMIKDVENENNVDFLEKEESKGIFSKIAYYLNLSNPVEWAFLIFFGIVVSVFLIIYDNIINLGFEKRLLIASSSSSIFNFIFYFSTSILFVLLATSVGYFISPDADGSGIPEIKTVLSGIHIYRYFSFNAFIGKIIGLLGSILAGLSTGKVGPFVHLSCIICNRLLKISYFSSINNSTSSKNNMLAAAAAAGVTMALGTPLGGVVFSIETTASIYIVSNIWKSFFCAVICIFTSKLLRSTAHLQMLDIEAEVSQPIKFSYEAALFALLGILGGVVGAALATFISNLAYIRKKSKNIYMNNRFRYAVIVAIIVSTFTYIIIPLRCNDRMTMNVLFATNKIAKNITNSTGNTTDSYLEDHSLNIFSLSKQHFSKSLDKLLHPEESLNLFIMLISKFFITVLSQTVNCPMGLFGPFFCIGALLGRLYGHVIRILFGLKEEYIYSMVGAACVMSGATHSISAAIIIFEITGQTSYLVPLLFSSLLANLVGQSLSMSIFDVLLSIKNLPHLPSLKSSKLYNLTAKEILTKVNYYFELKEGALNEYSLRSNSKPREDLENYSSLAERQSFNNSKDPFCAFNIISAMAILYKIPKKYYFSIPIIDSTKTIRFTVTVKYLLKYLNATYEKIKNQYNIKMQTNFNEFFMFMKKKFFEDKKSFLDHLIYKFKKLYNTLRDQQKYKLSKNFEEESIYRILSILKDGI